MLGYTMFQIMMQILHFSEAWNFAWQTFIFN